MKRDLLHKMYIQPPSHEDYTRLKNGMNFIGGYNIGRVDGYNSCLDDLVDSCQGEDISLWFDIDTVPKEGCFLVYVPSRKKHKVISAWMHSFKATWGMKEMVYIIYDHTGKEILNPTHWMRLPDAPTNSKEGI